MPTDLTEIEESEERETRRGRDAELASIEKMVRLLEDMDPSARRDAIDYLTRRYNRLPASMIPETYDRR